MWAQLITMRIKPGNDERMAALIERLRNSEQPGSGLIRETAMRDRHDPSRYLMLVVFESEEKARVRESDPRRAELLKDLIDTMKEIVDGAPEFVDLDVLSDMSH
jgi:quinol monooxygenase YgiN